MGPDPLQLLEQVRALVRERQRHADVCRRAFFQPDFASIAAYIEVGRKDELFDVRRARPEAKKVARVYRKLDIEAAFRYREHERAHELSRDEEGIEFLCRHLGLG